MHSIIHACHSVFRVLHSQAMVHNLCSAWDQSHRILTDAFILAPSLSFLSPQSWWVSGGCLPLHSTPLSLHPLFPSVASDVLIGRASSHVLVLTTHIFFSWKNICSAPPSIFSQLFADSLTSPAEGEGILHGWVVGYLTSSWTLLPYILLVLFHPATL